MRIFVLLISPLLLISCSLAPQYQRPEMIIPTAYKEALHKWRPAKQPTAAITNEAWWRMYKDPLLNDLEEKVTQANQDLKAALARYDEARATLRVAQAAFFPTVIGVSNASRQEASTNTSNPLPNPLLSDIIIGANLTYEVDVWGRVRNTVSAARNVARASAADLASIALSLHAELANAYFSLRGADIAQRILNDSVIVYQKSLFLVQQRYQGAVAPLGDVEQAKAQLETAKVMAAENHLQRAQFEHAIAVLIGVPPATFSVKPSLQKPQRVTIQADLPSELLERRPDVAEAELLVEAANANIGVARAAFFPAFNIAGGVGYESDSFGSLFRGSSLVWALGPTIASTLFLSGNAQPLAAWTLLDGGRIRALSDRAYAKYLETVANYRQKVLVAFQEVEDNLIAIRELDRENTHQTKASRAAQLAAQQAMYRYQGGLTTYLDVVVPQTIALQAELSAVKILTRRQIASTQLIKALGGGWNEKV